MTSVGTGYDLAASTYSPDGRLFQVEYAQKAVDAAGTAIGLKCTDGVVLAIEKPVQTRLLRAGLNRRIQQVDRHSVAVGAGLEADCGAIMSKAGEEAMQWRESMGEAVPVDTVYVADRLGLFVQQHTLYSSVRPFGAAAIVAGVHPRPALFMVEPTGRVHGYKAIAIGRGRQHARTELEKLLAAATNTANDQLSTAEGVKELIRILVVARQEDPAARERQVELEVAYLCAGQQRMVHVEVEAVQAMAKQALDGHNAAMDFEVVG